MQEKIIKDLIIQKKIIPYFQPIIDSKTKKIYKYEILARMFTEDQKLIFPDIFLLVAKESNLLTNITNIIIEKSFEIFSKNDFNFSINVSEEDLMTSDLIESLNKNAKKFKIAYARITIEILETINLNNKNAKNILENIELLKKYSYKIALDDFGTSYSNYDRFDFLTVDYIKVDKRFAMNLLDKNHNESIINSLFLLTNELHIKLIVEGIESEIVYNKLKEKGITLFQGYYIDKPTSILNQSLIF